MAKDSEDQYSNKEASARLVAALKGARVAESKPMKYIKMRKNTQKTPSSKKVESDR